MHPMIENLRSLSDSQIEQKILKLNSIYFITDNENVRQQMILLMDTYKIELQERQLAAKRKEIADGDNNGLDNLIRVS
jgi:uncharacterized protein YxjI